MKTEPNDLAFCPSDAAIENTKQGHYKGATMYTNPLGLTKREYFAAMAMQGLLANLSHIRRDGFKDSEISEFARMQADALINELNK